MAILFYITVGDKSLDPILEELANESSRSLILSSAEEDEAQAIRAADTSYNAS